jgi:putative cell wall-binding protein
VRRSPILSVAALALLLVGAPSAALAAERPVDDTPPLTAAAGGTVTATVLVELPSGDFVPAQEGEAVLRLYSAGFTNWIAVATAESNASGVITATVPPGDYFLEFASTDPRTFPVHEWYTNQRYSDDALTLTIGDGASINLGTVALELRELDSTRVAGADRFATAVAVSQRAFPVVGAGVDVVVVNGNSFADALSAGPLANDLNGSLLLVTSTTIPEVTRAEIDRLNPTSIWIVGGTGVVSSAIEEQLRPYAANSDFVYRLAGADRYATSRAVVQQIGPGINDLMIATGRNFPDALSAVPAANAFGRGALLLVDGTRTSLDAATRTLLNARTSADFWVVGGTGAVSAPLVADIQTIAPVVRLSGADRYATSQAVAFQFFVQADEAYLANGSGFADALAAGPVAAAGRAPVYLTRQTCIPTVIYDDILAVFANRIILVGGTGVLTNGVATFTEC